MNSDSRFAYFQLYNGTEIHLPRSVLELAAAPGALPPDSIGIEALAAAILGVSSIDFLGWGLKPPSQASNALETKMVRTGASYPNACADESPSGPKNDHFEDEFLYALFSGVQKLCGYFLVELVHDPVGGTWTVRVDGMSDDRRFEACETSLGGAVDYVLKKIEEAVLTKGLGTQWEAPGAGDGAVIPPSVGEIYGVPLLSRVFAVRPRPMLGRLCYAVAHGAAPETRFLHCNQDERWRISAKAEVLNDHGYAIPVSDRSQIRLALCCQCRSPQFWSPSGFTCKNGHGGADALPYEETPS